MMRSAVASLSIRLVRNSVPSCSSLKPTSGSCSNECFRRNDSSIRPFNSSRPAIIRPSNPTKLIGLRQTDRSPFVLFATNASSNVEEEVVNEGADIASEELSGNAKKILPPPRDPEKDRSKVIPVETGMRYIKSDAYKQTYGETPVWVLYRRNFKGQFAPKRTRKTCIRGGAVSSGNPCPICRDEFLVLDYRNTDLLKQFISPYNGEILSFTTTGLCQRRHKELLVAILKAKDYGTISFDVPVREYDYTEYEHLYKSYRES